MILHREITAVYFKNIQNHTDTHCGQNVYVKAGGTCNSYDVLKVRSHRPVGLKRNISPICHEDPPNVATPFVTGYLPKTNRK
jgi:hypothetical protein